MFPRVVMVVMVVMHRVARVGIHRFVSVARRADGWTLHMQRAPCGVSLLIGITSVIPHMVDMVSKQTTIPLQVK